MFSNGRDMTKYQVLHHKEDDSADAKATATPRGFSENSQAKNYESIIKVPCVSRVHHFQLLF